MAVKYNPPIIALEYYHNKMNNSYLLQINLEDLIKSQKEAENISKWIYNTYSDIFNVKIISDKQVNKLLQKILDKKFFFNSSETVINGLVNKEHELNLFEPDITRKEQEREQFYKSNQNFYSAGKEKINLIDEYEVNEDIKKEKNTSPLRNMNNINHNNFLSNEKLCVKNSEIGIVDYDQNYYINDMSLESLHSN